MEAGANEQKCIDHPKVCKCAALHGILPIHLTLLQLFTHRNLYCLAYLQSNTERVLVSFVGCQR